MSSISFQSFTLEKAAGFSKRIVVGTLLGTSSFRFPGSEEHPAQPEGTALHCFHLRVARTLKGPEFCVDDELRIFSGAQWFHHTDAELIKDGVISYADPHYSGGISQGDIKVGMDLLFFLDGAPAPAGFPPGSVFMGIGEAHDRADRDTDVLAALAEGAWVEFDHPLEVSEGERIRFPDLLAVKLLGHSHKRSQVEGPWKEWIDLELSKDGRKESLALAHCTDRDLKESWDTKTWDVYSFEVKAMSGERAIIIVRNS